MTALTLNLSSLVDKISDRQLERLSRDNPDARLETNSRGQLIFMSPTGGHRLRLPKREAPAVTVGKEQRKTFLPVEPDFVIELMSPTDVFSQLQQKMKEYINCGVKLGWLINPDARQVEIYRQGKEKEVLDQPQTLSGENILPGLIVDLTEIFD